MGKLSHSSTINYLRKIFDDATADYVDIETVYRNLDLDESNPKDRDKLYEWLKSMKERGLVKREYTERKRFKGLHLTSTGHSVVRDRSGEKAISKEARLARWRADAEILQTQYPELEIFYDMRLRKSGSR
ncbi:hypothetical protein ACGFY9_39880 [Streptomyces sp. NPDC048504]|uniref:hypothetical protein n=1 Tax=Streptomyces sp. NPDC048504 TaxID=3365559 RepID=UPI00371C0831